MEGAVTVTGLRLDRSNLPIARAFRAIIDEAVSERILIGDILRAMQDRATIALIFLFALPNALPAPPGTSAVLGLPILILATQFSLRQSAWLPAVVTRRSIKVADLAFFFNRAEPWLLRAELVLRPRWPRLCGVTAERFAGVLVLVLAIVLVLPIPLGNIPTAASICLISIGFLASDGLVVVAGIVAGIAATVIAGMVSAGLLAGLMYMLSI